MSSSLFFFFNVPATTEIYTLSLHDALPILLVLRVAERGRATGDVERPFRDHRSEEHTSELQSPMYLVCRLLLEKKKNESVTNQNESEGRSDGLYVLKEYLVVEYRLSAYGRV